MRNNIPQSSMNIQNLKLLREIGTVHTKSIYVIIFLENQTKFATASDDSTICIYETLSGKLIKQLVGHTDRIWSMIRLQNSYLVSGSSDTSIRVWDYKTGK